MPNTSVGSVFSPKYDYLKGKEAWKSNLRLTTLAADRIRSSLGPNGAYKMVTYNRGPEKVVKITKDAVLVLEELAIQYPTITVLAEAAKLHREQMGDGVKTFVILASSLLRKADELMEKGIHPMIILSGYEEAAEKAIETIGSSSQQLENLGLEEVLETADCGRGWLTEELKRNLIEVLEIASKDGKLDKDKIRIVRNPGGSQSETKFIKGLILKKSKLHPNMPDTVLEPKIAVTSERIGYNRLELKMPTEGPFHMKLTLETPQQLLECKNTEKGQKTEALQKLKKFGVNVLFSQQPIDSFSKGKLIEMGVLAFETVDRKDLELICKVSRAKIVGNLTNLTESDVGKVRSVETEKINLEKILILHSSDAATFLIRGSSLQVLDEVELLIINSLKLMAAAKVSGKIIPGCGAVETQIAQQLEHFAFSFSGREQLAVTGFADALLDLPRCLATNNGLNPDDEIIRLRKLQSDGKQDFLNSASVLCFDVSDVKTAIIRRAFEVASLMLRIDEQVTGKEIPKFHKK